MSASRRPGEASPATFAAGLLVASAAVFVAYGPALDGPFVFDDRYLPFQQPGLAEQPLSHWVAGLRPLLMATYWLNHRISGLEPTGYHVLNVALHLGTALLVFGIVRRLLEWAGVAAWPRTPLAVFAGGVFLLHPLQTESVAYVAGRSETLCALLVYAALAVFVHRRSDAISLPASLAILILFAGAVLAKEHAVVLPALLLATDAFWARGSAAAAIRRNWRLYVPLAVLASLGLWRVWGVLAAADSAGFSLPDLAWHDYFWTQCRAVWVYVRLFFAPYGQSADHDFGISRSPLDPGVAIALAGLVLAVLAAWRLRRALPLVSYGVFVFLLLLSPTSSVVPIADPLAERRLYLPSLGLLLVVVEALRHWNPQPRALVGALASLLVMAGIATHQRAAVWASPLALWEDTVRKSPANARARFQLGFAYYELGRCEDALREYETAASLEPAGHGLLVDWALACDCAGRPADALAKLGEAASLEATGHVYSLIGMIHGKQGRRAEAFAALARAESLDPLFPMTHVYRGHLHALAGEDAQAAAAYRRALELDPRLGLARDALAAADERLRLAGSLP